MKYLPPFEVLKSYFTLSKVDGEVMANCRYQEFLEMLRLILANIPVDEDWYAKRYPDIAESIRQGVVESARTHFVNDGYFEGRLPFPIRVDERYYFEQNPGVADHVRRGLLQSGQQHFDEHGYEEGRLPFGV
jgi:hypothetical protein